MYLPMCWGSLSYLLFFGVAFGLSFAQEYGSSSNNPEPQFGCGSVRDPNRPKWSNDTIPALQLDYQQLLNLRNLLSKVYKKFLSNTKFENIQNFLTFETEFRTSGNPNIYDFLYNYYNVGNDIYIKNQNRALFKTICRDGTIMNKYPNITQSMFFAATVPKASPNLIRTCRQGYQFDIAEFKQVTAAIKIRYTGYGYNDVREGYILFKPESNWMNPVIVIEGEHPENYFPHTGYFEYDQMIPDGTMRVTINREFPLRLMEWQMQGNIAGWKPLDISVHYNFIRQNYIANMIPIYIEEGIDIGEVEHIGFQNPLIYVGSPFCSFEEMSYKYDLISPYRAEFLRNSYGVATNGVFLTLTDEANLIYTIITLSDNKVEICGANCSVIHDGEPASNIRHDTLGALWSLEYILEDRRLINKMTRLDSIRKREDFMRIIFENNPLEAIGDDDNDDDDNDDDDE